MSVTRKEKTTSELANAIGATPDLIRKWKRRGFLPHSPDGQHGAGRGNECYWSEEAQDEVIAFAKTRNYSERSDEQRASTPTRKNRSPGGRA